LEQTTFAVGIIPLFMGTMGVMSGQPWSETEDRLRQIWWPTLLMNWKVEIL
jgi:hypothetical protein